MPVYVELSEVELVAQALQYGQLRVVHFALRRVRLQDELLQHHLVSRRGDTPACMTQSVDIFQGIVFKKKNFFAENVLYSFGKLYNTWRFKDTYSPQRVQFPIYVLASQSLRKLN